MANHSLKVTSNLLNFIPKRHASNLKLTHKSEPKLLLQKEAIKVTKLQNGIVVATLENHSPVSRIAVVVNAASRHETYDLQGSAHALRAFSNLSTKNHTTYGLTRTLDHLGANFSVLSTREQTIFNLIATRDNLSKVTNLIADIVNSPSLNSWEVESALERLKLEIEIYNKSPEIRIGDLLHRAAFRNGLSQSLYAPEAFVDSITDETLKEFRSRNYSLDRLALVGIGMKHEFLLRFAEKFRLPSSSIKSESSKFLGSEIREANQSETVHVAIASEGASLSSKELLVSGIVNQAFGIEPRVKWSEGSSRIARATLSAASEPATISSFNLNYTDSGLFGFSLVAHRNDVGKVAKALFKECAKVGKNGFTSAEIETAKNNLKASLSMSMEYSQNLIESIALSPENAGIYSNMNELHKAIDNVSSNDVNTFAKRLSTGKPSLAAIGDLRNLPRLDELNA